MHLDGPYTYTIHVQGQGYQVAAPDGGDHFVAPVTQRSPKLYTFSVAGQMIYIGQTVQSMSARLRLGFNANGANGYHGYAWRHVLPVAQLYVWCLIDAAEEEEGLALECIEAEAVYLYRQNTGQWPEYQTEIHFHPSNEEHRALAAELYEHFVDGAA